MSRDGWQPGAVVGDYRLLGTLGRGGMGEVFRAEHLPTGAHRALKSLAPGFDPELVVRFRREAEALARIGAHPHVVRVHEVLELQGRLLLVTELLEGGDLARRLALGPLPAEEVRRLGIALADGLAHAHARGVLHRDLKPGNVLFDGEGRPKLADFGLALLDDRRDLTRSGTLLGTPAYMAPEQALGGRADARSDVYGLGAVLYHAATGQAPVQGDSVLDLLQRVASGGIEPVRGLRPDLPAGLAAAIERALARDPAERFPDARALGQALEVRAGAARRAPWPALLLGGVALAGAVALAAGLAGRPEPAGPTRVPTPATRPTATPAPSERPLPTPSTRLPEQLEVPWPGATLARYADPQGATALAISPDAVTLWDLDALRQAGRTAQRVASPVERRAEPVQRWPIDPPRELPAQAVHRGRARAVVTAGYAEVWLIDLARRQVRRAQPCADGLKVRSLGISPDGDWVLVGDGRHAPRGEGHVHRVSWEAGAEAGEALVLRDTVEDLALLPDGTLVAVAGQALQRQDPRILTWPPGAWPPREADARSIRGAPGAVRLVGCLEREQAALGGTMGWVAVWSPGQAQAERLVGQPTKGDAFDGAIGGHYVARVRDLAWSPSGRLLVSATDRAEGLQAFGLILWDAERDFASRGLDVEPYLSVDIRPDERELLLCRPDRLCLRQLGPE